MGRYVSFAVTVSVLLSGGCLGTKVRPEPVSFTHPDEVVRQEGFMVLADRREFAVMAFLNATGHDEETEGRQMHPVRVKVRAMMAANLAEHADKVRAWRDYRRSLMRKRLPSECFQVFALSLSADYPFRRIRPDREVRYPYGAWALSDFPAILNDFWETAKLAAVWEQVRPDFIAEIRKYDFERMKGQMALLWSYLRMPRQDTFTLVNVPNLLERHYLAVNAHYENYYYAVESPGAYTYGLNVHEYLHSIINDLVRARFNGQRTKLLQYYQAGKEGPMSRWCHNPADFASECLVRALDGRLTVLQTSDPQVKRRVVTQASRLTENGLTLTQPFYNLLVEFEQSGQPFDKFLPTLLERLPECK